MFKNYLILLLAVFLLFACSKKNKVEILEPEINEDEMVIDLYKEAVEALEKGDAFYAAKKFKEVETLMPLSTWAAKASLMAAYAD